MFSAKHLIGAVATASFVALLQSTANAANFRCHGINYNPRNGPDWAPSDKKCKSDDAIRQDLATLKTVTDRIRLYSLTDCDQGARVIPLAKEAGFSVSVGLWVDNSTTSYQNEKAKLIELLGRGDVITNDRITDIHVGSEAVYRNDITAEENIAYMKEVRDLCRDKGVQVPVTIADIGDIYLAHDNLIDAVDFVSANGFPFWEKIEVDAAVSYMEDRMKPLFEKAKAKGKEVVISETGWASGGVSEGASKATPANAAKYFHDFYTLAEQRQWKYFYFAGFDEAWKSTNADKNDTVEAHFGLFTANRELKPEIAALTFDGKAPSPSPASSSAKPSASSGAPATGSPSATPAPGGKPGSPSATPAPGGKPGSPSAAPAPGGKPGSPSAAPAPGGKPGSPSAAPAPGGKPGSPSATPAPGGKPGSPDAPRPGCPTA